MISAADYVARLKWPGGTRPAAGAKLEIKVEALELLLRHAYTRGASDALAPLAEAAQDAENDLPDFIRGLFK